MLLIFLVRLILEARRAEGREGSDETRPSGSAHTKLADQRKRLNAVTLLRIIKLHGFLPVYLKRQ